MARLTAQQKRNALAKSLSMAIQPYVAAYAAKDINVMPVPATIAELETIDLDGDKYGLYHGIKFRYSKEYRHDQNLGPIPVHKLCVSSADDVEVYIIVPINDTILYNQAVDVANAMWSFHVKLQRTIKKEEA